MNLILGSQCLLYFFNLWTRRVQSPLDTSRQGNNIDHLSFYYLFRMHNSILFLSLCISQDNTDHAVLFYRVCSSYWELEGEKYRHIKLIDNAQLLLVKITHSEQIENTQAFFKL